MSSLKFLGLLSNYTCTSDEWPLSRGFCLKQSFGVQREFATYQKLFFEVHMISGDMKPTFHCRDDIKRLKP